MTEGSFFLLRIPQGILQLSITGAFVMTKPYNSFNSHSLLIDLVQDLDNLNRIVFYSKESTVKPVADH